MSIRHLGDVIIYLGMLAGALASMGVVARYVIVLPLKKWIIEQIRSPLHAVQAEVSNNGGGSMKDAVDRTERQMAVMAQRLDDHINHHPGRS
jgi:hypothetical protein